MDDPPAPVNMVVNPNDQILRYMTYSNDFMQGLTRQLDTNDVLNGMHVFSGSSAQTFRDWMRDLDRVYIDHPNDHAFMRRLVTRSVRDSAADFLADTKRDNNDPLTWPQIRAHFYERFNNYVDAQVAEQKLKKLRQERKQGLHNFAQIILDTSREAYTPDELQNPVVIRELKNIFIDGLRDHKISQMLIRENVATIQDALQRAVRDELLQQTYKLRNLTNTDNTDKRNITDIEVDLVATHEPDNKAMITRNEWSDMTASVAAIAAAVRPSQNFHSSNGAPPRRFINAPPQQLNPSYRPPLINDRSRYVPNNNRSYGNEDRMQHRHNYQPTHYNPTFYSSGANRPPFRQGSRDAPPLRWAANGNPVCAHCQKEGHIRRQCWTLYPNLRPSSNQPPQRPRQGN